MNFKRMRQEYERYHGKYSWLRTLGILVPRSHLPGTWIGIFIPDFGHSANNYAKLIFIKFVHPSTCNVFDAANEIAHDFYSIGQLPAMEGGLVKSREW